MCSTLPTQISTEYKKRLLNSKFGIQGWNPHLEFVSIFIITRKSKRNHDKLNNNNNHKRTKTKTIKKPIKAAATIITVVASAAMILGIQTEMSQNILAQTYSGSNG